MAERQITPSEARARSLGLLQMEDGRNWISAKGEWQRDYNSLPNWILLHSSDDLPSAHAKFLAIMDPYLEVAEVTVGYYVRDGEDLLLLTSLDGRDAIMSGPDNDIAPARFKGLGVFQS